jgi:glutathione synthase/RimK-type ligase-like ATP-grasp enzyme
MINVLIPTMPDDTHALFVHLALKEVGHKSLLWYTADFPTEQTHSFEIKNKNVIWNASGSDFKINNEKFDIVWNRRPRAPIMPSFLHPNDLENANKENMAFYQNFWQVIAPDAFWINGYENSKRANCKLLQLKIAAEIGLKIAPTLVSNDPKRIKNFITSYKKGEVIYKTLYQVMWISKEEVRLTYTKEISLDDLPCDSILQSAPGIFQKKIPKAFELRVNYMGNHVIAAKLNSQQHPKAIADWRFAPTLELSIEQFELPEAIDKKCREFMKKLGLVFGCFDFIVTPDNEYYFLEINEQGQFLWIEEVNPDIKMLDAFVNFLTNKSCSDLSKRSPSLSCADFVTDVNKLRNKALELHKNPDVIDSNLKN